VKNLAPLAAMLALGMALAAAGSTAPRSSPGGAGSLPGSGPRIANEPVEYATLWSLRFQHDADASAVLPTGLAYIAELNRIYAGTNSFPELGFQVDAIDLDDGSVDWKHREPGARGIPGSLYLDHTEVLTQAQVGTTPGALTLNAFTHSGDVNTLFADETLSSGLPMAVTPGSVWTYVSGIHGELLLRVNRFTGESSAISLEEFVEGFTPAAIAADMATGRVVLAGTEWLSTEGGLEPDAAAVIFNNAGEVERVIRESEPGFNSFSQAAFGPDGILVLAQQLQNAFGGTSSQVGRYSADTGENVWRRNLLGNATHPWAAVAGIALGEDGNVYGALHRAGVESERTGIFSWTGFDGMNRWQEMVTTPSGNNVEPFSFRLDEVGGRVHLGGAVANVPEQRFDGVVQSFSLDGTQSFQHVSDGPGSTWIYDVVRAGFGKVVAQLLREDLGGFETELLLLDSGTPIGGAPPQAPTELHIREIGPHDAALVWTDNAEDEQGFFLERRIVTEEGTTPWEVVATLPARPGKGLRPHRERRLEPNTHYEWRVLAFNDNGASDPSNIAPGTTPPPTRGILVTPERHSMKTVPLEGVRQNILVISNASEDENLLVRIAGLDAPFEVVLGGGETLIPPGGQHRVGIRFAPTERGKFGQNLRIMSSDPERPRAVVPVAGQGGR
jgi:outer membrane protein assembly factor BamB